MANGKWIAGLTPEMPADEAARVVLSVRLSAVRHHLPLAVEQAADDIEHVHQLRVATRRAETAVWAFRDFLPKKPRRRVKRVLRAVRRAAGAARDWDVFLVRYAREKSAAADVIAGYALRERAAAQDALAAVAARRSVAVGDACATVPAAVRAKDTDPPLCLKAHAEAVLADLFARFAREIEESPASVTKLHELRLTAKRLRYAMEVFAGSCAPSLREVLYPAVEEAQELLGAAHDAAVAASRLEQIEREMRYLPGGNAERAQAGIATRAAKAKGRAEANERAFREWVGKWRAIAAEYPPGPVNPST